MNSLVTLPALTNILLGFQTLFFSLLFLWILRRQTQLRSQSDTLYHQLHQTMIGQLHQVHLDLQQSHQSGQHILYKNHSIF